MRTLLAVLASTLTSTSGLAATLTDATTTLGHSQGAIPLGGFSLVAGALTTPEGKTGQALVGTQWTSEGGKVLVIKSVRGTSDYAVDLVGGGSLCGDQIWASAVTKTFEPISGKATARADMFYFSCQSGALERCKAAGFGADAKASVAQSCVRMVRADYCGDGVAHTRGGSVIDVYDGVADDAKPAPSGFELEAEWQADGAHCIRQTRWQTSGSNGQTDLEYIQKSCPERLTQGSACPSKRGTELRSFIKR